VRCASSGLIATATPLDVGEGRAGTEVVVVAGAREGEAACNAMSLRTQNVRVVFWK